jgi:NADH dehydrogenase
MNKEIHAVTGAFGYSGRYIAQLLLDQGKEVITLTNSPGRANPFGGKVKAYPYDFDDPERLGDPLSGAEVLHNTYWIRFAEKGFGYDRAVENSRKLFSAAKKAGVRRVVHISVTNPSEDPGLPYFSGKARVEKALVETGLSYAILRPAVLFGGEGILINNIAWMLRLLPVATILGDGKYLLQPVYVGDLAKIAVEQAGRTGNTIINAIGPETFAYEDIVRMLGREIGKERPVVHVPPAVGLMAGRLIGAILRDIVVTRDEVKGLMENKLYVDAPPAGTTSLTAWVKENRDKIGLRYASELARRRDRVKPYSAL